MSFVLTVGCYLVRYFICWPLHMEYGEWLNIATAQSTLHDGIYYICTDANI
jgi:hypothetical protein